MNKFLEETLTHEKPDPAFEQRMLAGFRNRIPQRIGLIKLLVDLMRLRTAQVTAVAAVLLALVQVGRMVTGENATALAWLCPTRSCLSIPVFTSQIFNRPGPVPFSPKRSILSKTSQSHGRDRVGCLEN